MAFELPALPYDYEALQPYMSKETLEYPPRQAPQGLCRQRQQAGGRSGHGQAVAGRGRQAVLIEQVVPRLPADLVAVRLREVDRCAPPITASGIAKVIAPVEVRERREEPSRPGHGRAVRSDDRVNVGRA